MNLRSRFRRMAKDIVRRRLLPLWYPSKRYAYGPRSGSEAYVLVCLWNRPGRLLPILEMLDAQDFAGGVRLFLWNNASPDHEHYRATLASFSSDGALVDASIVRSPFNLGSVGRFYWARWIVKREGPRAIIVIDDDQDISPTFVKSAMAAARPNAISAWWAFVVGAGYWDRTMAEPGESVNHVGPGGMVADASLFADPAFFRDLPDRFWMLDDVWVSAFALSRGYRLEKLAADIEFVMPETNQYHSQVFLKEEFFDSLASMREAGPIS